MSAQLSCALHVSEVARARLYLTPKEARPSDALQMGCVVADHQRGVGDKVSMKAENKLRRGKQLRELGTALFNAGRLRRAEAIWNRGAELFNCLEVRTSVYL